MFNPNTSEHREDNPTPLSLLSLPSDVREALQSVITSGELDLGELDLDQVNMPEIGVPGEATEKIQQANSIATEDEDQVMD